MAPEGMIADHINANILDNRLCNLRVATPQQSNWNRDCKVTVNKTGFKGVYKDKQRDKFAAYTTDRKHEFIGRFETAEEAGAVVQFFMQELFPDRAEFLRK